MGGISIPPVAGIKNKLINGCMRLAQRGTSTTIGQSTSGFPVDRWQLANSHDAGNITGSQDSSVPNNNFQYSMKITNAAGNDTSIGASQYCFFYQRVEGYNIVPLRSGKVTLSFWVKSSKSGTYCVSFNNSISNRSYVCEYSINSINTWEYKTVVCDLSAGIVSGTWDYINGIGLYVLFDLSLGSSFQTTPNVWQSSGVYGTSNQVNWLNEQNNTFYITGVQLEKGDAPTEFESRDIGNELRMCYRYYWRYAPGVAHSPFVSGEVYSSGNSAFGSLLLPVTMRATPVGYYSAASDFEAWDNGTVNRTLSTFGLDSLSPYGGRVATTAGSGTWTTGDATMIFTANTSAWFALDAEL